MGLFKVKKRSVFYISGFDPRGDAYYHRLYRNESAKQERVGGIDIEVGRRKRVSSIASQWTVRSIAENQAVHTNYTYLRWDDVVRDNWARNDFRVLYGYLHAFWTYSSTGALRQILKASWPPFVTSLFPLVFLLALIMLAFGAAFYTFHALADLSVAPWLCYAAGVAVFGAILLCWRILEKRLNSYWLLRIYAFSAQQGQGKLPDLDKRMGQLADHIIDNTRDADIDEILVVGHSTGTIMASIVLAKVLEKEPGFLDRRARVSLLTLGQCTPIISLLPQANSFRAHLTTLANATKLHWIDFTAPTDGACFALVDPLAVCGIESRVAQRAHPKLLSPRFVKLFAPAAYKKIRRNWYRNHFQYVMASELLGDYDYFAITAGPLTLSERFQARTSVSNYKRAKQSKVLP